MLERPAGREERQERLRLLRDQPTRSEGPASEHALGRHLRRPLDEQLQRAAQHARLREGQNYTLAGAGFKHLLPAETRPEP